MHQSTILWKSWTCWFSMFWEGLYLFLWLETWLCFFPDDEWWKLEILIFYILTIKLYIHVLFLAICEYSTHMYQHCSVMVLTTTLAHLLEIFHLTQCLVVCKTILWSMSLFLSPLWLCASWLMYAQCIYGSIMQLKLVLLYIWCECDSDCCQIQIWWALMTQWISPSLLLLSMFSAF